ncbi:2-C-methyl-D-erythritol 4-phosphate cytidylyltransferase [Mediannikoviicoccus vaginalis]|uniref:2-C-methyl-D-erythritol 4-phosphate cytidylyltransferase n=1 Tax=Mediannikoviicoccus vaginalis TaxID=2899727 RepID=UPI001F019B70|nr:2-C-methyl-D-erythritol 4-phosphate cytidylyltransferase [Mediannikoviicoccus vaginalis]
MDDKILNKGISVIITAAGSGTRMGTELPKQFLKLNNREIIHRTVGKFFHLSFVREIIIVVSEGEIERCSEILKEYSSKLKFAKGGDTREESTFNGLSQVSKTSEIVITHDGVRPFVKTDTIIGALKEVKENEAVVVCVPMKDTIKNAKAGYIAYTPNREELYNAQTPQIFYKDSLVKGYEKAFKENIKVTDDSSLMEVIGQKVKIYIGEYDNIKITTKEDLIIGEILAKMEDEN